MISNRLLSGIAAIMIAATPVLAQTAAPTAPVAPTAPGIPALPSRPAAPAAPAAATPARPATPAAAQPAAAPTTAAKPIPAGQRININTASAEQLDTLKGIGPARAKKIIEERAKARFANFDDLVKRNVLPSNVEADIKDKISF
jgi:competence protein ComEA